MDPEAKGDQRGDWAAEIEDQGGDWAVEVTSVAPLTAIHLQAQ